jgi:uncharacterized cupin superfamily protein
MPKIDIKSLPADSRTFYREPLNRVVRGRSRKRLGVAAGIEQFGVNYIEIGTRSKHERAEYPYVDLLLIRDEKDARYMHRDGRPYPK